MLKKISSESSLAVQDEPASGQKKRKKHSKRDSGETSVAAHDEPASEPKRPKNQGNEIDEIFSNKKRKKPKQEQDNKPTEDVNRTLKKSKKEKKSKVARTAGFVDPPVKSRKITEDGLTVYAEEELGIGKADAGGTPLCPFDCSCCF